MLNCQWAFFERNGERRAVGDFAGDERPADARFGFVLKEPFESGRIPEFGRNPLMA